MPIASRSGRVEMAINASADESRATGDDLRCRFLPVLHAAAEQLSLLT